MKSSHTIQAVMRSPSTYCHCVEWPTSLVWRYNPDSRKLNAKKKKVSLNNLLCYMENNIYFSLVKWYASKWVILLSAELIISFQHKFCLSEEVCLNNLSDIVYCKRRFASGCKTVLSYAALLHGYMQNFILGRFNPNMS